MKTVTLKIYYALLVVTTLGFAAYTVLVGSAHVANGQKIAQLERANLAVTEQKLLTQDQINHQLSFAQIAEVATQNGFTPSSHIIHLTGLNTVASR
jgi:hypothetical protein